MKEDDDEKSKGVSTPRCWTQGSREVADNARNHPRASFLAEWRKLTFTLRNQQRFVCNGIHTEPSHSDTRTTATLTGCLSKRRVTAADWQLSVCSFSPVHSRKAKVGMTERRTFDKHPKFCVTFFSATNFHFSVPFRSVCC